MLKNRVELIRYIRFQLAQMSARNDFHTFEQLCFELAKATIASNIIPATGPVQAGGDRGRDFETFKSQFHTRKNLNSPSPGIIIEEKTVFCCSLEKEIESKIKNDVEKVVSYDSPDGGVCYFCSEDIPIGKRLRIVSFCKDIFETNVQIFDGAAISTMLADVDVFWIAEHFLAVPSEFLPGTIGDEEYTNIRERWIAKTKIVSSADFLEVKYLLRRSSAETKLVGDLSKWLTIMEGAREDPHIGRRATYEIAMANFGKKTSISRLESVLSDYFREFPHKPSMVEIQDAFSLIQRAILYAVQNIPSLNPWKVREWRQRVGRAVELRLRSQCTMQDRYVLEIIKGYLSFIQGWRTPKALGDAVRHWDRAVSIAESQVVSDATLVEHFISEAAQALRNNNKIGKLLQRIDSVIELQEGKAFVANLRVSRGLKLISAGNLVEGLQPLLEAKCNFLTGAKYREILFIDLKLVDIYSNLELIFAARYFALSAILGRNYDPSDDAMPGFAAAGVFKLAETYYRSGEGLTALSIFGEALWMYLSVESDPSNDDMQKRLDRSQELCRHVVGALDAIAPDVIPICKQIVSSWKLDSEAKAWLFLDLPMEIAGHDFQDKATSIARVIGTSLTADLVDTFHAAWCALNLTWNVTSPRDVQHVAERLTTVLQMVIADYGLLEKSRATSSIKISILDVDSSTWTYSLDDGDPCRFWDGDEEETLIVSKKLKDGYGDHFDDIFALATSMGLMSKLSQTDLNAEGGERMSRLAQVLCAGPPVSMASATGRDIARRGGFKELPPFHSVPWAAAPRSSKWLKAEEVG